MQESSEISPQQSNDAESQKPYVLWDANIITYLGDKGLGKELTEHFESLLGDEYRIGISQFTALEALDYCPVDVEDKRLEVLTSATQFSVDADVINVATELSNLYKDDQKERKVEHGDRIIGATAAILNCHVCTADLKGYPYPYFKLIKSVQIGYKNGKQDLSMIIHYLLPDTDVISEKIKARREKRDREKNKKIKPKKTK